MAVVLFGASAAAISQPAPTPEPGPTPDQIQQAADSTAYYYREVIKNAAERQHHLSATLARWNWITKVGQYVGGGGAMLFGLNDKGRNAGYAGAVGAAFTVLDQVADRTALAAEREKCESVSRLGPAVFAATQGWSLAKNDPAFQGEFRGIFERFNTAIGLQIAGCNPEPVVNWQRMTQWTTAITAQ